MAEFLNRHRLSAVVCAATEYGKCQILPGEYLDVRSERLNADEMVRLIQEEQICLVIDATHPYAVLVSENIRNACEQTETEYLRLLRPSGEIGEDCILVDSVAEAVEWLKASGERALVTTGSIYRNPGLPGTDLCKGASDPVGGGTLRGTRV